MLSSYDNMCTLSLTGNQFGIWKVLELETMSDHQYVFYKLETAGEKLTTAKHGWAWRRLEIEKLNSFILQVESPPATHAEESSVQ